MTDILVVIGIEQLKKIDNILDEKVKIAEFYRKNFEKANLLKHLLCQNMLIDQYTCMELK